MRIFHQKEKKSSDSLREWGCLFSESVNDRSDGMGECAFNLSKLRDFSRGQLCGYQVAEDVERLPIFNINSKDRSAVQCVSL